MLQGGLKGSLAVKPKGKADAGVALIFGPAKTIKALVLELNVGKKLSSTIPHKHL